MGSIAIHGFGRIGRTTLRAALRDNLFVPTVISDIKDLPTLAALFEVDTNYGRWPESVRTYTNIIQIGNHNQIVFVDSSDELPDWDAFKVDVVIDATGRAPTRAGAQKHLDKGAKKVLISAPCKPEEAIAVLLPGINLEQYDHDKHDVISMASCTTNALAPLVKVLKEWFGKVKGTFTTVHAYTNTQSLTDQPLESRRDSWAAACNIVPTSSGAAQALKSIWPDLDVTGKAYRVPVATGSIVELNVVVEKSTDAEEVKQAFRTAATKPPLKGIMTVLEEEYASCRIVGEPYSSIVDLPLTQVIGGNFVSVAAWYDNEMGYATRLAETASYIA